MIIREINIDRFGTLSGRHYAFEDGLNEIAGLSAEEGTQLQAFIRAMLYGLSEEESEAFRPADPEGAYGGSMKVLSDGNEFLIVRQFAAGQEDFRVTRCRDNAGAVYPDLWMTEALGSVPKERFDRSALIRKADFDAERAGFSGGDEALKKKAEQAKIRGEYAAVRERLEAQCSELNEKIDWDAREDYDRSVEELKALKERQMAIREECPEKEKALEELKQLIGLSEEDAASEASVMEESLKQEAQKAREAFDSYVEKTQRKAGRGASVGTFLMVVGILLFICTWFYVVSVLNQRIPDAYRLYVYGAAGLSILLFLAGLISSIVSAVKVRQAAGIAEEDSEQKSALQKAEQTLEAYRIQRREAAEALKNDPGRLEEVGEAEKEVKALKEEIRTGTAHYTELYRHIETLREKVRSQTPYENEYKAAALSKSVLDKLIREADEQERAEIALSENSLSEVALTARLSKLSDVDPQKKLPLIAGDILAGMSESRRDNVIRDWLSHEGRQVILFRD